MITLHKVQQEYNTANLTLNQINQN